MLRNSLQRGLMGSVALVIATGGGALASNGGSPTANNEAALWLILAGCLAFLVPVGLTLLASGAASEDKAADVALTSLVAIGLGVIFIVVQEEEITAEASFRTSRNDWV